MVTVWLILYLGAHWHYGAALHYWYHFLMSALFNTCKLWTYVMVLWCYTYAVMCSWVLYSYSYLYSKLLYSKHPWLLSCTLYSANKPSITQLIEKADDSLFDKIKYDPSHSLHHLLPKKTDHSYSLRSRSHNFELTHTHDNRNFIDRMLFYPYHIC